MAKIENDLEALSHKIEKKGKDWNKAKQLSERCDELRKTILSEEMNKLDASYVAKGEKSPSEAKLERLARDSKGYRAHIEQIVTTRKISNDGYMEYEALKNLYDATRSMIAFERAKIGMI